ncbi:MAG: hypothetical protein IH861_02235 [Chloroflexi bacterium]|nr:hypothetical protein [Chloroflexota bacterium]
MGLAVILGIIGMTVAFIIGVMMQFPYTSVTTTFDPADETYSVEAVEEAGRLFTGNYMAMVDDITSYMTDPDYERAEARRGEMLALANTLVLDFQAFETRLKGELDKVLAEQEALEASIEPTPTPTP